jgi:hypothetical protein
LISSSDGALSAAAFGPVGTRLSYDRLVTEDLPVLTRFHREIVVPDIERIVGASEQRLRRDAFALSMLRRSACSRPSTT